VRYLAPVALFGGLLLGVFWNPPWWPFPHENNLSMTGLIRLHQAAGEYLEGTRPSAKVVTAWPLSDALRRPEFGYVRRPIMVEGIPDFRRSSVLRLAPGSFDILLLYSRNWEPPLSLLRLAPVERFSARYLDYEPRITATECEKLLSLKREVRWSHGGHWLEIWVPQGGGQLQSTGAGSS
jgi:hypothetical protein